MKKSAVLVLLLLCSRLFSQTTVRGKVYDAETGSPLSYANVQIIGTYKGTITNDSGMFQLMTDTMPVGLQIRYIGYTSRSLSISRADTVLMVPMEPVTLTLPQIVVTAEDPAVRIMRKVIENKQKWRSRLNTYRAAAYTRAAVKNDTAIVSISESTSHIFWHRQEGMREIVTSRQETSNISSGNNFAFAGEIPNLYDDDIELMEFRIAGPTHPAALKYYRFSIIGERRIDDKIVVDISLAPKNKLQPSFVGRVSIQLDDYAMIDIDVKPNDAMLFPPPIRNVNLHFMQQFSNFGREFWLPVDMRIQGGIKIGMTGLEFPTINYHQVSHLTDYAVNISMPDSLYRSGRRIRIDSASVAVNPLLANESQRIPLTREESEAYSSIDSTMTLEKAFRPTGFLAKMARLEVSLEGQGEQDREETSSGAVRLLSAFRPDLRYNRVDGLHAGLSFSHDLPAGFSLRLNTAYKTGQKRWARGAEAAFRRGSSSGFSAGVSYFSGSLPVQTSVNYPLLFNSFNFLAGQPDYFDYYWSEYRQLRLAYGFRFKTDFLIETAVQSAEHSPLTAGADWTLFGSSRAPRGNPEVPGGTLGSIRTALTVGDDFAPWGFIGFNRLKIEVEHADPALFGSDFAFTAWHMMLDGRIPTFFRRRFLSNVFDFRITAGTASGDPPPQCRGGMDVRLGMFTPFGTFRSLRHRPVTGSSYAAVFWEHNFRTVPFEILGMRKIAEKGISFIIHGASGHTRLSEDGTVPSGWSTRNGWYHEAGFSISGIFDIFRLDFTVPLNRSGFYLGLSGSKLF